MGVAGMTFPPPGTFWAEVQNAWRDAEDLALVTGHVHIVRRWTSPSGDTGWGVWETSSNWTDRTARKKGWNPYTNAVSAAGFLTEMAIREKIQQSGAPR